MPVRVNPYETPRPLDELHSSWWDRLRRIVLSPKQTRYSNWEEATLLEFLRGRPIVFEGAAFLVDPSDHSTLHAAIALRENEPSLIDRCTSEVQRLLPAFVDQFPDLKKSISQRGLLVRFIDTYLDLESEVTERRYVGPVLESLDFAVDASASQVARPLIWREKADPRAAD
jgi:hypothetical protein